MDAQTLKSITWVAQMDPMIFSKYEKVWGHKVGWVGEGIRFGRSWGGSKYNQNAVYGVFQELINEST